MRANARKRAFSHAFFDTRLRENGACVLRVRRPLISDLYCTCTLIDNDTRHHSGQNLLWTHSAAPRESTTF